MKRSRRKSRPFFVFGFEERFGVAFDFAQAERMVV